MGEPVVEERTRVTSKEMERMGIEIPSQPDVTASQSVTLDITNGPRSRGGCIIGLSEYQIPFIRVLKHSPTTRLVGAQAPVIEIPPAPMSSP